MKDERTETTKQNNFYPDNLNSNAKDKNYYNLNIATFTFGGKQEDRAQLIKSPFDKESLLKDNITINNINQRRNNSMRHLSDPSWKQDSQRNATKDDLTRTSYGLKSNQDNNVINVKGQHDSFLSAVIRCIWNMKIFRNFILNELPTIIENDNRPKLISSLKLLFVDYAVDKPLDLHRIRKALALLFQSRRKFLIDHPDDPVDCYFSIVNAIHCNYMVSNFLSLEIFFK